MTSAKYLVIISVDALNKHDYEYIQTLPTFKTFFEEGAHSKEVTSVFPTVTYTCHTSLSTGHYPHAHQVYNNELPQPSQPTNQDWHWFEKDIKVPTIFDYAKQAGLTTATFLWPVMADADVTYNIPEIWSPDESVSKFKLFWRYGTKNALWPVAKYSKHLKGKQQPYLDNFTEAAAMHIMRKHRPNLTAIHFTDLDTMRHLYGLGSQQAIGALKRIDQRIHNIIQLYKDLGIHDETNYVLLGDHGTHDFDTIIELNTYFADQGLLTVDGQKTITHWDAYACTCGGSAQIHLNPNASSDAKSRLDAVIDKLTVMPKSPIKQILTKAQAMDLYKLSGDFEYVLEAKDQHVFRNTVTGQFTYDSSLVPGSYIGDHGFSPEQVDQKTLFLMKGPSIKPGASIEHSTLVDEAPTMAALLGLTMEKTEGKRLDELLL